MAKASRAQKSQPKRDRVQEQIDAACGVSILVAQENGRWVRISDEDAQGLRDGGRGAEVQRVWVKDPDFAAFTKLLDQCPPDVQDMVAEEIRRQLRQEPELVLAAIKHARRTAADPTASTKDRRTAEDFLKRHGFDDASLADEE